LPAVVLLGPSLAFLAAFTYWPVMRVVAQSVMVGRFAGQTTVGFDNYQRLFADPPFARAGGTTSPMPVVRSGRAWSSPWG
jgi:ABC-type sugar transport system permease subunit